MTIKGSEILNKIIGAGLMLASAGFFADMFGRTEYIIPGLLFGAGGFVLVIKRDRRAAAELEAQQRVDQLADGLAATQAELNALQERLDRLSDERDFMRQLTASGARPSAEATQSAAAPPGGVLAAGAAEAGTRS